MQEEITITLPDRLKQGARDGYIAAKALMWHIKAFHPEFKFPHDKTINECALKDLTYYGCQIKKGEVDKEDGTLTLFFSPRLNEAQIRLVEQRLEEWLRAEGVKEVNGLEIKSVEYNHIQNDFKAFYSYENNECKLRSGSIYFTAHTPGEKVEDVTFFE